MTVPALVVAAALAMFSACDCGGPPPPPPDSTVGQISAVPVDGGFELRLTTETPVRSLQVDVLVDGAQASAAEALGGSDVLEAGLSSPRRDFTVVVSDTRRRNLPAGAVAKVTTDAAPSRITLSNARAVDTTGTRRTVTVVVP